jgi:hypothetical protein
LGRACADDYLGAHALFDPLQQVIRIEGEEKVWRYLNAHPEVNTHLREPKDSKPRQSLYLCGASAIWKRVGDLTKLTADVTPQCELTYKPCHQSYPKKANAEKESAKGKARA